MSFFKKSFFYKDYINLDKFIRIYLYIYKFHLFSTITLPLMNLLKIKIIYCIILCYTKFLLYYTKY